MYGSEVKEVQVVYRAGKENTAADALSRSPQAAAPVKGIAEDDFQIAAMSVSKTKGTEPLTTEEDITSLLDKDPDLNPGNRTLQSGQKYPSSTAEVQNSIR